MIEAEITCTCRHIELQDLGLVLVRGQKVFCPYADAEASLDLHRARRAGAVSLRPVKRFVDQKPAHSRPQRQPQPPKPAPSKSPAPVLDLAPQIVSQIPVGLTREEVAAEVQVQLAGFEARLLEALAKMQPQQVVKVVGGTPVSSEGMVTVEDSAPIFIPSKIVSGEVKGEIKTRKTEAENSGLEDAAAALKAARKGKKQ